MKIFHSNSPHDFSRFEALHQSDGLVKDRDKKSRVDPGGASKEAFQGVSIEFLKYR
jgi:hypothetical protein